MCDANPHLFYCSSLFKCAVLPSSAFVTAWSTEERMPNPAIDDFLLGLSYPESTWPFVFDTQTTVSHLSLIASFPFISSPKTQFMEPAGSQDNILGENSSLYYQVCLQWRPERKQTPHKLGSCSNVWKGYCESEISIQQIPVQIDCLNHCISFFKLIMPAFHVVCLTSALLALGVQNTMEITLSTEDKLQGELCSVRRRCNIVLKRRLTWLVW